MPNKTKLKLNKCVNPPSVTFEFFLHIEYLVSRSQIEVDELFSFCLNPPSLAAEREAISSPQRTVQSAVNLLLNRLQLPETLEDKEEGGGRLSAVFKAEVPVKCCHT